MLKSKWTHFFIALLVGSAIGSFFVLRKLPDTNSSSRLNIPDITFYDIAGEPAAKLSDYQGKTILMSFWASWCEPCKKEIPELVKLKNKLKEQNFEVVLVNEDDELELAQNFLDSLGVDTSVLISLYDKQFKTAESLRVESLPATYLIDKEGKEVFSSIGYIDWLSGAANALVMETVLEK